MEHHGKELHRLIRAKGFNLQQVADKLPKNVVSVQRDVKAQTLTRKVINRYADVLGFELEDFFSGKPTTVTKLSEAKEVELLREIIQEQRKRLDLQDQMIRFFPSAARMG